MKIVSFNLRCCWEDDINSFLNRIGGITHKICCEKPDVICFQEATEDNISVLQKNLTEFEIFFNQRCSNFDGEGLAVAIRKDTIKLLSLDFFWMSETPDVPGSRFAEQSDCPRITQVLLLQNNQGKRFWVYNTHLDHISDEARVLGVRQIVKRILKDQERYVLPFFLLGDFNATPESETIRYCNTCKELNMVDLTANCTGTFHDFGRKEKPIKIDYIYTDEKTSACQYSVNNWHEELYGVYLSDHDPVGLEVNL